MSWDEIAYDMYLAEEGWKETVHGIKEEALIEFAEERYRSFFVQNPEMHLKVLWVLDEAKKLHDNGHFGASVIYSFSAVESILRDLILRPLIWGTFIDAEVAGLITDNLLLNRFDQLSKFIFHFIEISTGVNLQIIKRTGQSIDLWREINEHKVLRNSIVHRGTQCDKDAAVRGLDIANYLYKEIFLKVLKSAGFEIDANNRIAQTA
jgi:hypothetical protein